MAFPTRMHAHSRTPLAAAVLAAYLVLLLKLFVFKDFSLGLFPIHYRYPPLWRVDNNYVPLTTIVPYLLGHPTWGDAARNVLGNIFPFLPIGLLLPLIRRSITWKGVAYIGVACSLGIEILELVLRAGIFDLTVSSFRMRACMVPRALGRMCTALQMGTPDENEYRDRRQAHEGCAPLHGGQDKAGSR